MPWTAGDAQRHNKKATGRKAAVWAKVANQTLARSGDDGQAIREANAAVGGIGKKKKKLSALFG